MLHRSLALVVGIFITGLRDEGDEFGSADREVQLDIEHRFAVVAGVLEDNANALEAGLFLTVVFVPCLISLFR